MAYLANLQVNLSIISRLEKTHFLTKMLRFYEFTSRSLRHELTWGPGVRAILICLEQGPTIVQNFR